MKVKSIKRIPKRRKKTSRKWGALILLIVLSVTLLFTLRQLDKKILPSVLSIAEMQAKTQINTAISEAVNEIMSEKKITASDFFSQQSNSEGKINSMAVNTVLVNELCNQIAVQISVELNNLNHQKIRIPMGSMLGIQLLADYGPSYNFSVMPTGDTVVDYQSKMDSAGINQINFQVWLDVTSSVRIVNPLQQDKITVTRNIPLVNTVISEEVPNTYWNPQAIPAN
jgi:sporulation protein YunB